MRYVFGFYEQHMGSRIVYGSRCADTRVRTQLRELTPEQLECIVAMLAVDPALTSPRDGVNLRTSG